jgi:uncharacterized damage-inducible protein DinB
MHVETLAHQLGLAEYVVDRNLDGITHAESLARPAGGGNSLNWVMGHLVQTYEQALLLLGHDRLFPAEEMDAYGSGRGGPADAAAVPVEELVRRFRRAGAAMQAALLALGADDLARPASLSPTGDDGETVGSLLSSIAFHQAYHAGQTGTLRRLLGHRGAILGPGEEAPA